MDEKKQKALKGEKIEDEALQVRLQKDIQELMLTMALSLTGGGLIMWLQDVTN